MKKVFVWTLFTILLMTGNVFGADFTGTPIPMDGSISVDADGNELKWEEGNHDYFIMFKSLLDISDECTEWNYDNPPKEVPCTNPQADQCLPKDQGSTYTLKQENIPNDAVIDAAYLIWTSAVSQSDFAAAMDNNIDLKFTHKGSGFEVGPSNITASRSGYLSNTSNATGNMEQDFEFEGFKLESDGEALYTYRVEVTDFFNEILISGREEGVTSDGLAYLGDYNVSGMDCFSGYSDAMVSNWAIVFVYSSSAAGMKPKKIYMYNGLRYYVAQEAEVTVSGFTFPDEPSIRTSLMVSEGDAGKQMASYQGSPLPPEGLFFKGAGSSWESLTNKCNPEKNEIVDEILGTTTPYNYTEMFNSISSVYDWNQYNDPSCIGGVMDSGELIPDQNNMEWAIDVDTFVMNSSDYPSQLKVGGNELSLKISTNADGVITNFLVVSLDTKPVAFDIPEKMEKTYCSCSDNEGNFCLESDFYFLIKVQNWGMAKATDVKVTDKLPPEVKYVPGTTEIATQFDSEGRGLDWMPVDDASGSEFPLKDGYKVADAMIPCDAGDCEDTVLLRFKVKPESNLPKHSVVSNIAIIEDASGVLYRTNSSVPLRLRVDGECSSDCKEPDLSSLECGGIAGDPECVEDNDCDGDLVCVNGRCVDENATSDEDENGVDDTDDKMSIGSDSDNYNDPVEDEVIGCSCSIIGL